MQRFATSLLANHISPYPGQPKRWRTGSGCRLFWCRCPTADGTLWPRSSCWAAAPLPDPTARQRNLIPVDESIQPETSCNRGVQSAASECQSSRGHPAATSDLALLVVIYGSAELTQTRPRQFCVSGIGGERC